jgi:hypothetical protein
MILYQFPTVLNHATTVHKLQGKSLEQLVIMEWAGKNVKNFVYVSCSRVQSLKGLFLVKPIPADIDFEPDPLYLAMMDQLREHKATAGQISDLQRRLVQLDNEL